MKSLKNGPYIARKGRRSPMKSAFVSVIIPVFNDSEKLALCLGALSRQTYPADLFEVIVVDNNSTDSVESVMSGFPGVRLERESHQSLTAARNAGISAAHGEIFAFTDADCIPDGSWIAEGVKAFSSAGHCGAVGGKIELFFRDRLRPTSAEIFESLFAFRQDEIIKRYHQVATANAFTSRSIIEEVGDFDASVLSGGDMEWGRRVCAAGYSLCYAPSAIVKHPARATLRDLLNKHMRVKGGFYDIRRKKGAYPLKEFLADLKNDWPHLSDVQVVMNERRCSWLRRVKVLAVLVCVRTARLFEMVRLIAGGRSRWG